MRSRPLPYLLFVLALLIDGCSGHVEPKSRTLILDYGEFGPPTFAYELIGTEWYQWNNHGDSDPHTFDDVNVVVYRNISLEEVKRLYPVNEKELRDFRYLEYKDAIEYLNKYESDPYLEHLAKTKKKIIDNLGS